MAAGVFIIPAIINDNSRRRKVQVSSLLPFGVLAVVLLYYIREARMACVSLLSARAPTSNCGICAYIAGAPSLQDSRAGLYDRFEGA